MDLPPIMLCPKLSRMLKPHQKEGVRWLWTHFGRGEDSCGCMLADHMGLGKTIQTIALVCAMMGCGTEELLDEQDQEETSSSSNLVASTASASPPNKRSRTDCSMNCQPLAKCILVLAPKTVVDVWVNQTRKFLGGNALDVLNTQTLSNEKSIEDRTIRLERWKRYGGLLILGYEMYRNLALIPDNQYGRRISQCLCDPGPGMLVLDEGHRLRNNKNQIYRALMKVKTKRRLVLTGYPMQNHLMEYFAMVDYIRPGFLGTRNDFDLTFSRCIENGQAVDSNEVDVIEARKQTFVLYNHVAPIVLRRDGMFLRKQLPPKREWVLFTRLSDIQYKVYKAFQRQRYKEFRSRGGTAAGKGLLQAYHMCLAIVGNVDILKKILEDKRFLIDDEDFDLLNDDLIGSYTYNPNQKRLLTLVDAPIVTQYSETQSGSSNHASPSEGNESDDIDALFSFTNEDLTSSPSTVGGSEGNGENPAALPAEPDVVCIIEDSDSDQDKDEITKDISSTVDRQTQAKKETIVISL